MIAKRIVLDPVAKLRTQAAVGEFGVVCNHGCTTFTREGFIHCWERGHFDTPVYDYIEVEDGQ